MMDMLYQYMTGRSLEHISPIIAHPAKSRKVGALVQNYFFENCGFSTISATIEPLCIFAAIRMSAAKRSSLSLILDSFCFNLLYFASVVRRQRELLSGKAMKSQKAKFKLSGLRMERTMNFRVEMHFENEVIQRTGFDALDSSLSHHLMMSNMIQSGNVTFDDMINNSGELLLLEIIVV